MQGAGSARGSADDLGSESKHRLGNRTIIELELTMLRTSINVFISSGFQSGR